MIKNNENMPDLTISDIKRITGIGNSKAYSAKYHGEYQVAGKRLVRREIFEYRRKMGLDVCIAS